MSQRERTPGNDAVGEKLGLILDSVCRFLWTAGGAASLLGVGFLIYNFSASANVTKAMVAQAHHNIDLFGLVAICGLAAVGLGVSYLNWGEEVLGPLLMIVWGALYFSPAYLPLAFANSHNAIGDEALATLQRASLPLGAIGLIVVVADVMTRVKLRTSQGAKADQLKYGKGLKEEKDIRNVFMGKCWQLPYCRKFVRERCPIYHARRTCWKERVGCMCEESVIRNAMEGRIIPADSIAAAKYIPQNTKLTAEQKAERCRQCVIYNEHQKHKYKLAMPCAIGGTALVYVFFREPMSQGVQTAMAGVNKIIKANTYKNPNETITETEDKTNLSGTGLGNGDVAFSEVILVALLVVALAYVIRFIEYLFFKAKV